MTGFEFRCGPAAGTLQVLANGHLMGTVSFDAEQQAWLAEADQQAGWFPSFGRAVNFIYEICEPPPWAPMPAAEPSPPPPNGGPPQLIVLPPE